MPALSIYDTEGNRIGEDTDQQSERIAQFSSNGGWLTLDASGDRTQIVVRFSARDSESSAPEQYYAMYQGNPRALHDAVRKHIGERHGLSLVPGRGFTVYGLFVPGISAAEPDEAEQLDGAATLLTDEGEATGQVKLGAGTYQDAREAVRYFLNQGYTRRVAVTENASSPELRAFDLVVETGEYSGIEVLPETERALGGGESAAGSPSESAGAAGASTASAGAAEASTASAGAAEASTASAGAAGASTASAGAAEASTESAEAASPAETAGRHRERAADEDQSRQYWPVEDDRQRRVLAILGVGAVVLLLVLGAVLVLASPFGGGGGGAEPTVELSSAEVQGADGVVVEGTLSEGSLDDTTFTVDIWEGQRDDGTLLVSTDVAPEDLGSGAFSLRLSPSEIASATAEFEYHGETPYEVVVKTDGDAVGATTLDRGALQFGVTDVAWTNGTLEIAGNLTQAGRPVPGDSPELALTLDGNETVTPAVSYDSDGSFAVTITDDQTGVDLTGGGELSVTAAYEGAEDTATVQRPEPTAFEVAIQGTNAPVTAGETLSVTVEITNTDETEATRTVELDAGALGTASATVTLAGQESRTGTLTVDTGPGDAGEYTVTAASESNTATTSATVQQEQADPSFEVSVTGTNSAVTAGEDLTVTAEVTNTGEATGTQTVELDVGTLGDRSADITLSPGESTTTTFTVGTGVGDAGEYAATVTSEDTEDSAFVAVQEEDTVGALFEVSIDSTNSPVTAGEQLTVAVDVTNTGEEAGTQTLEVDLEALGNRSTDVSLAAGETTTRSVTFDTGADDVGSYTVVATSENDGDSTLVTVEDDQDGEPSFEVSINGTNTPAEGEELAVTVEVENTGNASGTRAVTLTTEPELGSTSTSIQLSPDGSTVETLSVPTSVGDAGEYAVTVASPGDEDNTTATVEAGTGASFDVSILGTNAPVAAGEALAVTVEVTNTGDASGTQLVELAAGDLGTDTTQVGLAGGVSTEETLTVQTGTGDAGEYTIAVDSEDNVETTSVTVEADGEPVFEPSITGTNAPVAAGDALDVTVEVTNTGDASGTQTVELAAGALGTASTQVELAAGASTEETLTVQTGTGDAGEYTVSVTSGDAEDTTSVAVEAGPEPVFELSILGTNAPVTAGSELDMTVEVTNTGNGSGTQTVELAAGALGTASTQVELAAGASTEETLTVGTEPDEAGEYTATVTSEDDEVTTGVTVEAAEAKSELSGLDIVGQGSSATTVEGESGPITVDVTNAGSQPPEGGFEVTLSTLGISASKTVSPDPGTTETVSFDEEIETELENLPAGDYDITVSSGDDSVSGSLTVEPPVDLSNLDIAGQGTSATITAGADESISIEVLNVGPETDSFSVQLQIGGPSGQVVDETRSTGDIPPDGGFVVIFEGVTNELSAGEYTVDIATVEYSDVAQSGSLTVEAAGGETGAVTDDGVRPTAAGPLRPTAY